MLLEGLAPEDAFDVMSWLFAHLDQTVFANWPKVFVGEAAVGFDVVEMFHDKLKGAALLVRPDTPILKALGDLTHVEILVTTIAMAPEQATLPELQERAMVYTNSFPRGRTASSWPASDAFLMAHLRQLLADVAGKEA